MTQATLTRINDNNLAAAMVQLSMRMNNGRHHHTATTSQKNGTYIYFGKFGHGFAIVANKKINYIIIGTGFTFDLRKS